LPRADSCAERWVLSALVLVDADDDGALAVRVAPRVLPGERRGGRDEAVADHQVGVGDALLLAGEVHAAHRDDLEAGEDRLERIGEIALSCQLGPRLVDGGGELGDRVRALGDADRVEDDVAERCGALREAVDQDGLADVRRADEHGA
jgi:hypothetical protein